MLLDAYGVWTAAYDMTVKRVSIAVKNLPAELEGLTIAQLSDIHVSSLVHRDRVQKIVDATNALKPDVVLITGDFVDGEVDKRGPDLQPLTQLKAPLGVWGVLGNHEYYVDYEGWRTFLPTLNIGMLYNAHTVLTKNGASFTVAGLLDPMAERYGLELPDLNKALAGAPETDLTILLSHQPKWAQKYVNQAQLMLSGHTHGAQVWPLRPVVSELNSGFVEGLYPVTDDKTGAKLQLYVNPGIDVWNGFVLRIGTRGEITLLTLTREKNK
ncbi:MAG: metallophosphoesterase [Sutterellaceae bacterium]|nr:metallophosphoesterase [Sutterellaceae bacterium]